ncbi:MAG: LLM class flavin-dependent oxidoreductase, partial [Hyphomicrobiaceae bacterium]
SPKQVADHMEAWFTGRACDGFVLAAPVLPGAYEDIARLVVPELQKRGLHHKDYRGKTLRDNLQLGRAQAGDWR